MICLTHGVKDWIIKLILSLRRSDCIHTKVSDQSEDSDNSHIWRDGGFMIIRLALLFTTGTFQLCHGDYNFPVCECQDLRGAQLVLHTQSEKQSDVNMTK